MNPKTEELKKRTKRFAIGVGSNYRATCRARSRAEFVARICVALEQADESAFWLEVLMESSKTLAVIDVARLPLEPRKK